MIPKWYILLSEHLFTTGYNAVIIAKTCDLASHAKKDFMYWFSEMMGCYSIPREKRIQISCTTGNHKEVEFDVTLLRVHV